jgi:cytochrome c oxidase subunit 3
MAIRGTGPTGPSRERNHASPIPHGMMGMILFVMTEVMLFAGLISAFSIVKASAIIWPPPGQPRLPIEATAFNTVVLLLSGVLLVFARRAFWSGNREGMRIPMLAALGLGIFFVVFQGSEWAALIGQGLTLTSSTLGSFFYLMIGMHALHAVGAIGLLGYAYFRLTHGFLSESLFAAAEVFWYFVVGVWPVLYSVVYL